MREKLGELRARLTKLQQQEKKPQSAKRTQDIKIAEVTSGNLAYVNVGMILGALIVGAISALLLPVLFVEIEEWAVFLGVAGGILGVLVVGKSIAIPFDNIRFPLLEKQESMEQELLDLENKLEQVQFDIDLETLVEGT